MHTIEYIMCAMHNIEYIICDMHNIDYLHMCYSNFGYIISYLRVDPWALRLYHPEALLYSLRRSRRLYSGAEGWYNLNAHGETRR